MSGPRRLFRRLLTTYHHRCAREDVRRLRLAEPLGVWLCDRCDHVALSARTWGEHWLFSHA
jgi:ribosomal protein L37AE/L43A